MDSNQNINAAMNNRQSTWNEIIRITHSMHTYASNEEWDNVSEMEAIRQVMMKNFFDQSPSLVEAEWIAKGINEILELDKDIMKQGRERMGIISQQLHTINVLLKK